MTGPPTSKMQAEHRWHLFEADTGEVTLKLVKNRKVLVLPNFVFTWDGLARAGLSVPCTPTPL